MKTYLITGCGITAIIICLQLSCFRPETSVSIADLGKKLFFDPILSGNRQISCASCHIPAFAFADSAVLSLGVNGRKAKRNTPSAMNLSQSVAFFWDGRAATLEEQALFPIANPDEMDLPVDSAVARLRHDKYYNDTFLKLFNKEPDSNNLSSALAAFERTLETSDSPFDEWKVQGIESAVSASAKRGFELFNGSAQCVKCHFGGDFSNTEFRNIGLYDGKRLKDSGRAAITGQKEDLGKFKIGPLRNIALTAPYMHNGMFSTLREVIDYYDNPDKIIPAPFNRDSLLSKPLNLSQQDKVDLENFLRSLTSKQLPGAH